MRAVIIAAVLAALSTPVKATADPIFYSAVSAGTTHVSGQTDSESEGVYYTSSLGPFTASLAGAHAKASVTDGQPHAYATSAGLGTSATGYASFFDTLFLTSDTLAIGTHVELLAEVSLHATLTGACGGTGVAFGGLDSSDGSIFIKVDTCGEFTTLGSAHLGGTIGQEMTINAYLNAGVGAFSPMTVDAFNTLAVFLTPVGEFSFVAASGLSYVQPAAPPVAEPSTLWLLGSGLAAAGLRGARHSRLALQALKFRSSAMKSANRSSASATVSSRAAKHRRT